ncbi:MAG: gamma-glutamylcyclotransferase [Gemmatimonadota bacterium]|nr:gamma-glutamylcyclotransferase [Gemmatimonadota bacterium]
MPEHRIDVFFYGLFMDQQLLEAKGVQPTDPRPAAVSGFELRIGARAALAPVPDGRVHGLLMKLSHADLERLYAEPSVRAYRPVPVLATVNNGQTVAALCYNLPDPPSPDERNTEYATKLRSLAKRVGLPTDYVASIR